MSEFVTLEQSASIANGVLAKVKAKGYAVAADLGDLALKDKVAKSDLDAALTTELDGKLDAADVLSYTIKKQAEADEGYSSTYQLFSVSADAEPVETAVGAKINIPKDMVVSSGTVETVTVADEPYEGAVVGDKYIDLVIANKAQNHLYIPVGDLVDVYTSGNGLSLVNNEFSVVIDSNSANGLSVGANGIALAPAVASVEGVGGSNGAMTAAQAEKLAGLVKVSAGESIDITNSGVVSVKVNPNTAYSNGLDSTPDGLNLALATAATPGTIGNAGAMSAADKEKLDSIEVATAQDVQDVISNLDDL